MASAGPSPGMEAVWEVGRKARESGRLLAALPVEDRNKVNSPPTPLDQTSPLLAVVVEPHVALPVPVCSIALRDGTTLTRSAAVAQALELVAASLENSISAIEAANKIDCDKAAVPGSEVAAALQARLKFGSSKIKDTITGVRDLMKLADPINEVQIHRQLDAGLTMKRVTVPLGVLGIIFEARPDAAVQVNKQTMGLKCCFLVIRARFAGCSSRCCRTASHISTVSRLCHCKYARVGFPRNQQRGPPWGGGGGPRAARAAPRPRPPPAATRPPPPPATPPSPQTSASHMH